jgi:hypothetical protein
LVSLVGKLALSQVNLSYCSRLVVYELENAKVIAHATLPIMKAKPLGFFLRPKQVPKAPRASNEVPNVVREKDITETVNTQQSHRKQDY